MSRRASRVDANHGAIRDALRKAGAMVVDLSAAGSGVPDFAILHRGVTVWAEIKDGEKSASRRKLTSDQVIFHGRAELQGVTVHIVTSVDEALALVGTQ